MHTEITHIKIWIFMILLAISTPNGKQPKWNFSKYIGKLWLYTHSGTLPSNEKERTFETFNALHEFQRPYAQWKQSQKLTESVSSFI